jgi:hypothetical protein
LARFGRIEYALPRDDKFVVDERVQNDRPLTSPMPGWALITARAGCRASRSSCRYWTVMSRTGIERAPSAPPTSAWSVVGNAEAYAAAFAAFAYALVSLYWAVGGHGLVGTVGGYVEQFTRRGGAVPVLVALAATVAKVAGGLLALALVRPWGRRVPRRWLLLASTGASALLVAYGGLNVLAGALVLSSVIHPAGSVGRNALRWHVGVWDLWFLVWGILLALATIGGQHTAAPPDRRDHRTPPDARHRHRSAASAPTS